MTSKYFGIPFAVSGDKTTVPDAAQPSNEVSFTDGWGEDYEKEEPDIDAKDIPRQGENYLKFVITEALKEIQEYGGKPYDPLVNYPVGAFILGSDNKDYKCLIANGPASLPVVDPVNDITGTWKNALALSNIIYIDSQIMYDAYFDGAGTKTGNIYLADVGINYQLNNNVIFGPNFRYDGDPGVVTERAGLYKFTSAGTVGVPISGVHLTDKLIFDGKKATHPMTTNGGFADLSYCNNSRFEMNIIDSETSVNGGAYFATLDTTLNNVIKNITGCEAANGAGVYGCYNSDISNVSGCIGDAVEACLNSIIIKNIHDNTGIGVKGCDFSLIHDINDNSQPGVDDCEHSTIFNIFRNGIGVNGCLGSTITNVAYSKFDGVIACNKSNISNVHHNGVTSSGTGVASCLDSTIDNIHDNPEGGCNGCNRSTISNIYDNTGVGGQAGGCAQCDDSSFSGSFKGNTTTGSYKYLSDCENSIAFILGDSTDVKISTVRATIDF